MNCKGTMKRHRRYVLRVKRESSVRMSDRAHPATHCELKLPSRSVMQPSLPSFIPAMPLSSFHSMFHLLVHPTIYLHFMFFVYFRSSLLECNLPEGRHFCFFYLTEIFQKPEGMPNGYEMCSKYLLSKQMNALMFTRLLKGRELFSEKACQECLRTALKKRDNQMTQWPIFSEGKGLEVDRQ